MLTFQYIYLFLQKLELTENGNFCLFPANGKQKRQTSFVFMKKENRSLFSLVGKR